LSQILKPKKGYKSVKVIPNFVNFIIPEEWEITLLSELSVEIRDGPMGFSLHSYDYVESGVPLLRIKNLEKLTVIKKGLKFISKEKHNELQKSQVKPLDIIISKTGILGVIGVLPENYGEANLNQALARITLKEKQMVTYVSTFLSSKIPQQILNVLGSGRTVQAGLKLSDIKNLEIPIPPLPEQQKIASILSRVDACIESTQKVIDQTILLKTGLMQKLLTRGIGHKKFKKVKWLFGKNIEIPKEWEVRTLGSLITLLTNGFVGKATEHYTKSKDGILYVQGYNIEENGFNFHGIKYVSQQFHDQHPKSCLELGDLLTIQTGGIGTTAIVLSKLVGANCHALIISRFKKEIANPYYYCQYFNSKHCQRIFKMIEIGTSLKHLNGSDMKKLQLLHPPLQEQQKIASILSGIDAYIQKNQQYKEKIETLKKGLMQKLLTGQIRVNV